MRADGTRRGGAGAPVAALAAAWCLAALPAASPALAETDGAGAPDRATLAAELDRAGRALHCAALLVAEAGDEGDEDRAALLAEGTRALRAALAGGPEEFGAIETDAFAPFLVRTIVSFIPPAERAMGDQFVAGYTYNALEAAVLNAHDETGRRRLDTFGDEGCATLLDPR